MPFIITGVQIECGKCKKSRVLPNPDHLAIWFLEKKLEAEGWYVIYGDGLCLCPNCMTKHNFKQEQKKISDRIKKETARKKKVLESGGAEI